MEGLAVDIIKIDDILHRLRDDIDLVLADRNQSSRVDVTSRFFLIGKLCHVARVVIVGRHDKVGVKGRRRPVIDGRVDGGELIK